MGYRNISYTVEQGQGFIWLSTWDQLGNRIEKKVPHNSYCYIEQTKRDKLQMEGVQVPNSLFGNPLVKKTFRNMWERHKWAEQCRGVKLFEKLPPTREYLLSQYSGIERDLDFVQFPLRVFFLDIEVQVEDEFPKAADAKYPINVISLIDSLTNIEHIWASQKDINKILDKQKKQECIDFVNKHSKDIKLQFHLFEQETDMLEDFLDFWVNNFPDIITGWNCLQYDMVYIINRLVNVFDEDTASLLSPLKKFKKKYIRAKNLSVECYSLEGISIIDYLLIYKKFNQGSKQSFKLDDIGDLELGIGKLDYEKYDHNIKLFMESDFGEFVKYNVLDSLLILLLDNKLQYIMLTRKLCNLGLCEYEAVYQSMPYVLGALCIQAQKENVRYLTDMNTVKQYGGNGDVEDEGDYGFTGAFVYPTQQGFYKRGIGSWDFNSLYPNIIITINISPDTKVGKLINYNVNSERHNMKVANSNKTITISNEQLIKLLDTKCTLSANHVLYYKPTVKRGIVCKFLIGLYEIRKASKKQMIDSEKKQSELIKQKNDIDNQIKQLEKQLNEH